MCDRSGSEYERNLTYNNGRILAKLGIHPDSLRDQYGLNISERLHFAYYESFKIEKELRELEPNNGWGGLIDCRDFIWDLYRKCKKFPKGIIRVS